MSAERPPDRLTHDIAQALLDAGVAPHGMTVIDAALAVEPFVRAKVADAVAAERRRWSDLICWFCGEGWEGHTPAEAASCRADLDAIEEAD